MRGCAEAQVQGSKYPVVRDLGDIWEAVCWCVGGGSSTEGWELQASEQEGPGMLGEEFAC